MGEYVLNASSLNQLNRALVLTNRQMQAEREKLTKLLDFNQQPSTVFSGLAGLKASVSSGLSAAENYFGQYSSTGQFTLPKDMTWKMGSTVARDTSSKAKWEEADRQSKQAHLVRMLAENRDELGRYYIRTLQNLDEEKNQLQKERDDLPWD